jgi:hypothetical protein
MERPVFRPAGFSENFETMALQRLPDLTISSSDPDADQSARALIQEIRSAADCFIFLSGGASHMADHHRQSLLAMFDALRLVAESGYRIAVGDGGTQAGIMEAAGRVREASKQAFPLIGVAPAAEVPPLGSTPLDPHHSHVVAVRTPPASGSNTWGSETATMYWLFQKLAEARPSVTIVANGGEVTLSEVEANILAGRRMILVEGSGRAADAIASLLRGTDDADSRLAARAQQLGVTRRRELYQLVGLDDGAAGLRAAIVDAFEQGAVH